MRTLLLSAILISVTALSQSCGSSSESAPSSASPGTPATRQASAIPLGPSFSSLNQNIFSPKCLSCHSGSNHSGNVDFTSYDSLVHNPRHSDVVVAGKPEESHLYEVLNTGGMPPSGPALSAAEVQAVSDWIAQGAQNN